MNDSRLPLSPPGLPSAATRRFSTGPGSVLARADFSFGRTQAHVWLAQCTALLIAIIPALPPRAFAGTAEEGLTQLPALEVEEDALTGADATQLPFIVRREQRGGRSILTLMDTLRGAPGVLLQESFGGFEPPRLSIRGSGLQSAPSSRGVAFLLDGYPLGLADGSFNAAVIDLQLAGRVEIDREAGADSRAAAVLGGAINLRGPRNVDSPASTLQTVAGSFGAARLALTTGYRRGDLALDAAGSFFRQDGYREHSGQQRDAWVVHARRPAPVGSDTSLSVYHAHPRYAVPGPLTFAVAAAAPRSVTADVQRDQPERESEVTQVILQTRQENGTLAFETGLSWLHSGDWFRQLQANGVSRSASDDFTWHAALNRRWETGIVNHRVRLGTTLTRGWRDFQRYENNAGRTGPLFGHDGLFATTAAAELGDTVRFGDRFAAEAGLTALSMRRDIHDRLASSVAEPRTDQALSGSSIQPHVRVAWTLRRELSWHAGVTRASEPPTFDDLLFVTGAAPHLRRRSQRLATQHATTWELGTNGTRGVFDWDVTAYTAEWSNEILRLADDLGLPRGAVNASATRHQGVEASVHWHLLQGNHPLRLVATAAWSHFTFVNDPVLGRNRLAGAPPHQGFAELIYEPPAGLFAALGADWIAGATPVDHAGRLTYGGHTLLHARAGWRRNRTWSLFMEVKNALDRRHIASTAGVLDLARNPAATSVFLPGLGRSLNLGFEWRFR